MTGIDSSRLPRLVTSGERLGEIGEYEAQLFPEIWAQTTPK